MFFQGKYNRNCKGRIYIFLSQEFKSLGPALNEYREKLLESIDGLSEDDKKKFGKSPLFESDDPAVKKLSTRLLHANDTVDFLKRTNPENTDIKALKHGRDAVKGLIDAENSFIKNSKSKPIMDQFNELRDVINMDPRMSQQNLVRLQQVEELENAIRNFINGTISEDDFRATVNKTQQPINELMNDVIARTERQIDGREKRLNRVHGTAPDDLVQREESNINQLQGLLNALKDNKIDINQSNIVDILNNTKGSNLQQLHKFIKETQVNRPINNIITRNPFDITSTMMQNKKDALAAMSNDVGTMDAQKDLATKAALGMDSKMSQVANNTSVVNEAPVINNTTINQQNVSKGGVDRILGGIFGIS